MSDPGYRVVALEEVPITQVLELLRLVLGEGPLGRTEATFRWKHRETPFGPSPGLAAVAADGTLVGVRLFQRWRLASAGAEVAAARAVDTATHPSWHRRGIFRSLTSALAERLRAEGTALIFNTPNPRSWAGYRSMGWRSLGRTALLVRPLRPVRIAGSLLRGQKARSSPSPATTIVQPAGTAPVTALLADPAFCRLIGGAGADEPRLHTQRTTAYLGWRYAAVPVPATEGSSRGAQPAYGALWRNDASGGAAVIARSRKRRGLTEVLLCELIAHGESGERLAADLLDELCASSGADYLAATAAPGTPERRTLRRAGLLPVGRRGPLLVVRDLTASPHGCTALTNHRGWRLSAGDLELF